MFIYVVYKTPPELSEQRRSAMSTIDLEDGVEKILIVNPKCYIRIMLEYIRKHCQLAESTQFDLADESGRLKQLFTYPTYTYLDDIFDHRRTYYLVVFWQAPDAGPERPKVMLPQIPHNSNMYLEMLSRIRRAAGLEESSTSKRTLHGKPSEGEFKIKY